jgi:predicted PurR-regulated permease PerM
MRQKSALIFLAIALAVILPLLFQVARPFFTPFILASILAIMLHPLKEWLKKRMRRHGLASFLTTLAAVSILGVLVTVVGVGLTGELTDAYNSLNQSSLGEGGWPSLAARATEKVVDTLATRLPIDREAIRKELINRMKSASAYLLRNIGVAVGGVTNVVVTCLLMTIFLYFLLRYGNEWVARLAALTPLDPGTNDRLIRTVRDSVLANLNGMLAVIVAQGLLLSLAFWIIGVRSPVLWGMLGGLASIVPVLGSFLVWAPVAIAYVLEKAYWQSLFLVLWGIFVVGSADNLLRPWIVGKRNKLHPMLIALAAIGGTYAFGALGILLGPLLISLAAALMQEIQLLISKNRIADRVAKLPWSI